MRRAYGAAIGIGFLAMGCAGAEPAPVTPPPPPAAAPAAETPAAPEAPDLSKAILAYVDAFNGGALDKAAQAFADDAEWVSAGSLVHPATGRAEIARGWQELRDIFDIKVGVRRLIVSEGMWVAQGVLSGAHIGGFHGQAATQKPVGVEYVHVGWIEGGKIKRLLSLSNGTAFTGQIGYSTGDVVPIPDKPSEVEVVKAAGDPASVAIAEALEVAILGGDVAASPIADDATLMFRATGQTLTGADAIRKRVSEMGGLTGITRDVKSVAAGPYVVTIGTTSGAHKGTSITFHTVEVITMKDQKAVAIELYRNPKEISDQMPEPAPAAKKK